MTIRAVLFDYSGTLFRLEQDESWLTELTNHEGEPLDIEAQAELMRRMTAPVGQVVELDAEHVHAWRERDRDPVLHRKVYLEVLKKSGVPHRDQAEALYDRLIDPSQWTPYPDTEAALKAASERGLKVGVLSNIAFDIRPAFTARGWDAYVDEFVLSFEVGAIKPELEIFRTAVQALGVPATETLMVGDSEEADGGARALGCEFALVDPLPTADRPDALLTALRTHGVG
ncbi:Haloacid dehalogenase superfamily, subfamily IA, variant 2 with 3rd motif like haloacid dehalogenase/haloacid dehalogenase superfamily, subfamily IA, variant 3 with third motif having DD or ED [Amycolatopsis pretoriensis]|uniref:Haloacid dehalogenase superfamily, subfamily IA, variant 2 with 3rd motif like haloacid dehalogenase/haloacid dehalogenase superfamily, subfamily IA, variant 3 with third motif having DD or ED n=1 Tax=Amycolatopsis pretoriensis TaxID=218821 RepID=A0A1H5QVU9_9PSEU|nr:HAD family hydrolase [Amycolatopsis pretoriensis]SEF29451.1 Haloacid dehalogenase superfamily, subfamily IA, variant 2 with 3rd motif like haloacid dehalogenase/haloacid dehalogenase superfamily, subfamily IA, variant 3 with third motif having DD or ED [Amycolatopsis pretoriensis]